MSKGAQQAGTTTSTQVPAPYMYPYMGTALGQAGNLLKSGGPQYYPGQTVAPFNPLQEAYFSDANKLAGNQGLTLDAGKQLEQTLDGRYLNPSSNPYLRNTFNTASGAVEDRLNSEFAGAGRNAEASLPLQAEQMNNLATQIYGQNYQDERNRQMSALGMVPGQEASAWANINNLGQAGAQLQGQAQKRIDENLQRYNYYQNKPYDLLRQYEGFLGGVQPGMQTSNPYFNNPLQNMLESGSMAAQLYNGGQQAGWWGGGKGGGYAPSLPNLTTDSPPPPDFGPIDMPS